MPLRFNMLLADAGIDTTDVRLLRHQAVYPGGRTPFTLWRENRAQFLQYQSSQNSARRAWFRASFWASFVVDPQGRTVFVGLFAARLVGPVPPDMIDPLTGLAPGQGKDGAYDLYDCRLVDIFGDYIGCLHVDWGPGTRTWVQRADRSDKPIVELKRAFEEEAFPGFTRFVKNLSEIETMPLGWKEALRAACGIYLLVCPRTGQHYVGQAAGADGFLGRWREYAANGHGGNVGLRLRDRSDYQVSVLETVGTNELERIGELEVLWKRKLLSKDMGLNRNW